MIICILDKDTKIVLNRVIVDSVEDYIPKNNEEVLANDIGQIGWIWNGETWTDPTKAKLVRRSRDLEIKNMIDTMNPMRWESFTAEQKQTWLDYRQALLDIPQQEGFPDNVIWPTKPTE
jgi:hypothetical protein